ncbi:MAG: relaxase/mobilization nuclease domain-containing protein [Hyphomicrobium sp.]|jgi:hypothetical protein|uniref:relaxase/mobilization nuclease domain-containing protein n=1 Tax=Hyphomicrobium sp. TaxID=82 RepID=UPI0025B9B4E7|nr:relaxase/mobilization nuclease domain-containing protein [Hyphomicrobium sp.]MBX9863132.1 relaxase/mobilization nuclease domain-containing protein [Hyphomicrobium sp.]
MIPRVAKSGKSYKGALLYFSHDVGASTAERLGFVEFVNLPIIPGADRQRDVERAGAIMAWTAIHQDDIKRKHHHQLSPATPYRPGRKLSKPVYSFSLRFAPDDAMRVDSAMLKRAAHGALKALGMERCQAVILEHKDSVPPHVHVLVCPIDPKTGQTISRQKDFYKLSSFAQKFSREHQLTILHQREENNARRKRGEFVKYAQVPRADWALMRNYRGKTRSKVERERRAQQEGDRQQLAHRQRRAVALFKKHLSESYGRDKRKIDIEIATLSQRMSRAGLFAIASRAVKRLTGQEAADKRRLQQLINARDNVEIRLTEARAPFARTLRLERQRMQFRHAAELMRDEQYFATRERRQSEGEKRATKLAKAQYAQATRDRKDDGLASVVRSLGATTVDTRSSLAGDGEEQTAVQKKWTRAQGRNPDRPHRPRNPYVRDEGAEPSPDQPRRRRRRR